MQLSTIEVLACADCRALAVSVNDTRITGHKCSGRWDALMREEIPTDDLVAAAIPILREIFPNSEGRNA